MTGTSDAGNGTTRRRLLGTALALPAVMLGRTAQGQAGGGLGTAASPINIRLMATSSYSDQWQTALVPEFNKLFPHIKVQIDGVPYNEHLAKIMLDLTGTKPTYDLYAIDDPWVPQVAQTGQLLDLRKEAAAWTDADFDWDDFNPAPLAASEWKGVQYGVPVRSNLLMMFYNRTHFAKAGLPEPTPKLTWTEFRAQLPKLVQNLSGSGPANAWGISCYFTRDTLTPCTWQSILNAHGGELVDPAGKPIFDNDVGRHALQTHIDLLQWAPPGARAHGFTESLQAFRQGQSAVMFQWGSVFRGTAVDAGSTTLKTEEVGIQVMPVGTVRAGTHRGIWNGCISRKTPNQRAAWAFWQWLSSKKGEAYASDAAGSFPARKSTLASTPASAWLKPVFTALQDGYETAAAGRMWRPRSPKSDQAQQILADETARAFSGDVKVAEALTSASRKIERLRL